VCLLRKTRGEKLIICKREFSNLIGFNMCYLVPFMMGAYFLSFFGGGGNEMVD
jgi:hypothetical protein